MGQGILPVPHPEMKAGMKAIRAVVRREIAGWQAMVWFEDDQGENQTLSFGLCRGSVREGESKLLPESEAMEKGKKLALQDVARYAPGVTPVIVDEICTEKRGAA